MKRPLHILACGLLLTSLACASIYTWVDAQGRTHYGDAPPTGKARPMDIKDNTLPGSALTPDEKRRGSQPRVVLYSASWCGYCQAMRTLLRQRGVSFSEYDIETSTQGRRDFERLRGTGIPITLIGASRIDGYDARRVDSLLEAAGY